jgi:hypothetical protein
MGFLSSLSSEGDGILKIEMLSPPPAILVGRSTHAQWYDLNMMPSRDDHFTHWLVMMENISDFFVLT